MIIKYTKKKLLLIIITWYFCCNLPCVTTSILKLQSKRFFLRNHLYLFSIVIYHLMRSEFQIFHFVLAVITCCLCCVFRHKRRKVFFIKSVIRTVIYASCVSCADVVASALVSRFFIMRREDVARCWVFVVRIRMEKMSEVAVYVHINFFIVHYFVVNALRR